MKIETKWQRPMLFHSSNENQKEMTLDAHGNVGGQESAFSPMEAVIGALGGCMGINVVHILRHYQDQLKKVDFEFDVDRADEYPRVFTEIRMNVIIEGDLPEKQVVRAVDLSHHSYCSVANSLSAPIKTTIHFNGKEIKLAD